MKAKDEKLLLWTLPNRLCIIRILFIPLIIFFIEREWVAFILFILAGITDGLDGFVARRFQLTSKLGLYLDPIADKLLVSSVLITLTYYHRVPLWITILLVCREFIINGLRSFYALEGITIYPSFTGKLKTALQIVGISCILLDRDLTNLIGLYVIYAALFFSMYSAINYITAIFKPRREGELELETNIPADPKRPETQK
ncbi:MAG: CDP-diacylglycerol--glycerol-3-phosphate 3-phosphatidyltransferase [Syntrophorhabdaceae bacterium]|mgnify:CR=1 FL=1|nr:CDP-diacylglycerol--glycerol-3-phosphate 3-phosphatidyltransferase [Syntrophorhabdaceae bacterium]MDD4194921.1 CDP-diacylglycerol--glycerol-3-phosphate 3-phosphatidyltransferase [Syntrophorhabdaceae bacterium]